MYDIDHRIQEDGSAYNPVDGFVEDLISLVEFAGWQKLILITFTTADFPYLAYFRKTIETLKRMKVCIEIYNIDPRMEIDNETVFIRQFPEIINQQTLVIVFGYALNQVRFLNKILRVFGSLPFFPKSC